MHDEHEISAHKRKRRSTDAECLRDYFCSKPFDQTLAAYYPNTVIEKYGITSAKRAMDFTRRQIERSGYRGWYVIVVHDKKGSTLWHPHMLLDGRNDQFAKVTRALHRFADVNYETRGPVVDLGSCAGYMAMRACENGLDSDKWEFAFMGQNKKRRPRGSRGRGHRKKTPVEQT